MTRFAWLQARTQTLTAAAALAAIAIVATITGVHLAHLYSSLVVHCKTGCDFGAQQFSSHDQFLDNAFTLIAQVFPALLGMFWGAPLVARELDSGTYRLAWTQSVSRRRWLLTRLGLVGLATVIASGVLTLTITWWSRDLDKLGTNNYAALHIRGVAPIGYALFAFASGALIGAVIRRTVPAMAATLGVFVFVRVATTLWVRPHLLSPLHKSISLLNADQLGFVSRNGGPIRLAANADAGQNTWTLSSQFVSNATGHVASNGQLSAFVHQFCPVIGSSADTPPGKTTHPVPAPPPIKEAFQACQAQAAKTFHLLVTYQPANRYWIFQWLEFGIFAALALLAAAGCYWWVTRRTH
jgi:hypothetical protein